MNTDCFCASGWSPNIWLPGRIELPTFGLLAQRSPTELSEHTEVPELEGSSEALCKVPRGRGALPLISAPMIDQGTFNITLTAGRQFATKTP